MSLFPSSIASFLGFTSGDTLKNDSHGAQHNSEQAEIVAIETKVGTGSSTPVANTVLRGLGAGVSSWAQVVLTTDVTGVLPQANGGTGRTDASGSGAPVYQNSPTISTPTLSVPVVADFSSAQHDHSAANKGGQLNGSTAILLASLTGDRLSNSTVTADKLATGGASSAIAASEQTASASYAALTTPESVTVVVGANGLLLLGVGAQISNSGANTSAASFSLSGANTLAAGDQNCIANTGTAAVILGRPVLLIGLTPGSTVVTMLFKAVAGTATFANRNIFAIPL